MQPFSFRQLLANLSLLTVGELFSKICTFVAFAWLARALGPAGFGYLELTLAWMIFLTLAVDLGSSPYGAREVALDRSRIGSVLAAIVRMRILFALVAAAAVLLGAFLLVDRASALRPLMLLYGATLLAVPGFTQWVFQGLDRMHWVAMGSIVRQLLFVGVVLAFVRPGDPIWHVGLAEVVAVSGFVAFNTWVLARRIDLGRFAFWAGSVRETVREALPVGLGELTWAGTMYSAPVWVWFYLESVDVGWFGAGLRPIMTLHTFVWLYFYNLLPALSRCRNVEPEAITRLVGGSLRVAAWASVAGAVFGLILAPWLLRIAFGADYGPSVAVFRILVWVLPVAMISGHYRYALIAYGFQRLELYASLAGAAVSLTVAAVCVPRLGIAAAAWAILAASVVSLVFALSFARSRIAPLPWIAPCALPILAGALACIGWWLAGGA